MKTKNARKDLKCPKNIFFFFGNRGSQKGGRGVRHLGKIPKKSRFFLGRGGVGGPYLLGTLELRMRDPDRNRDQIGTLTKHNMDKLV